jgi:hypothetical protein
LHAIKGRFVPVVEWNLGILANPWEHCPNRPPLAYVFTSLGLPPHLEVRVGNVEASGGGRQVFGAVATAETDIAVMIRRSFETVGRTTDTEVTAFTDGAPGLRSILSEAGYKKPPIADWFHIAMRLQHAKQAAAGLSTDTPGRTQAKAVIVPEVERLHRRIWNGKAKNAWRTLERVRKVMHVFQGERGRRTMAVPSSRKLWHALHEVDNYLRGQSARLRRLCPLMWVKPRKSNVSACQLCQTIPSRPARRDVGD